MQEVAATGEKKITISFETRRREREGEKNGQRKVK